MQRKTKESVKYYIRKTPFQNLFTHINVYRIHFLSFKGILESKKRKNVDIFNYKYLAQDIRFYHRSKITQNNYYGIYKILKPFFRDLLKNDNTFIEHGLYFGGFISKFSATNNKVESILTFGLYRKNILKNKTDKKIVAIGPYIKYAKSLLDKNKFIEQKNSLGKTLLVFPAHSLSDYNSKFNFTAFLNEIEKVKNEGGFNTVIINMYWVDIQKGLYSQYEKKGYKITTAGHIFDEYFLNRLKSLIELSDYTMSNKFGTHVGYCIHLNKPHYIFNQKIIYISEKKQNNIRDNDEMALYLKEEKLFNELFGVIESNITNKQRQVVKYYFGE